jgi:hypothetical protein
MKTNLLSLLVVMSALVALPWRLDSQLGGRNAQNDYTVAFLFPAHPPRSNADSVAFLFPTHPPRSNADGVAFLFPTHPPHSNVDGVAC